MLDVTPIESRMNLIGWLPEGASDRVASEKAAQEGVQAAPLSAYCVEPLPRVGLVLGFTAVDAKQIKDGIKRLARALA